MCSYTPTVPASVGKEYPVAQRPEPPPCGPRWTSIARIIGTYLVGLAGGLFVYPLLTDPALVGSTVVVLGVLVLIVSIEGAQAKR
jgi:hypothetical protein